MSGLIRIAYENEDEKERKLCAVLRALGYHVEKAGAERITIGQLANRVGRKLCTVSMSLRRPSCPPFECKRGKRRIIWIEPNERLIAFLAENRKGQRN